ncbi:MAG: hypothetical protein RLN85_08860, partial [Pseudomonadales bacterium]
MAKMTTDAASRCWLPDLCKPLALLRLILLAVLITLVLILLRQGIAGFGLDSMGVLFLYAVWVVFISAAGLCFLRKFFGQLSMLVSSTLAILWLAAAATICASAGYWALRYFLLDQQISWIDLWGETTLTAV